MAEEPRARSGWLPPRAPAGREPPRYDGPEQEHGGWAPPVAPSGPRPRWVPPERPAGETPTAPKESREDATATVTGFQPPDRAAPTFVRPGGARSPRDPLAILGLVLGIAGLGLLVLSLGLSFALSLPLSAAGWVCALRARGRRPRAHAPGQVRAGIYLGIAGVALGLLAAAVWIALLSLGFDLEAFRDGLERELERQRSRDEVQAAATLSGR